MNIVKSLVDMGITVEGFEYHADRLKAGDTRMWGGKCTLIISSDLTLECKLWSHLGMKTTEEEIWENMSIKGIRYEGESYDAGWHTIMTDSKIWLHKEGWCGTFYKQGYEDGTLPLAKFLYPRREFRIGYNKPKEGRPDNRPEHKGEKGVWGLGFSRTDFSKVEEREFEELGFICIVCIPPDMEEEKVALYKKLLELDVDGITENEVDMMSLLAKEPCIQKRLEANKNDAS